MRLANKILLVATAAAFAFLCSGVAQPAAAAEQAGVISWSVVPADAKGPDGRRWVDIDVDPGASVVEHLAVTNHSDEDVSFGLDAADARFTAAGRFDMLPASDESTGAGTWISVGDRVDVPSKGTVVVPFVISVPWNATPGDNAAGIAASFLSTAKNGAGAKVGLDSRVGFRVMMRVSGELTPTVDLTNVDATYSYSWNPFQPGSVDVRYTPQNTGNVRFFAASGADASGRLFTSNTTDSSVEELLPGDARAASVTVREVWPIGLVRVVVTSNAYENDRSGDAIAEASAELWVWALPMPQIVLILGVALLASGLFWRRRRQRDRLEDMLDRARQEGAAVATGANPDRIDAP